MQPLLALATPTQHIALSIAQQHGGLLLTAYLAGALIVLDGRIG
jgi:hypothetical protein